MLDVFRVFPEDVATAWEKGTDDQKNRLARQMFDIIWTKDEKVVAVRPRAELRPFFQVSEWCQDKSLSGDPDRIRTGGRYFSDGWYPVYAPPAPYQSDRALPKRKITLGVRDELVTLRETESLRQLAQRYGVSHETVRQSLLRQLVPNTA